jgi:hypothetical protein
MRYENLQFIKIYFERIERVIEVPPQTIGDFVMQNLNIKSLKKA